MNNKYDPNKSELIISSNRNLAVKKSSVIKRGLELVNELVVRKEKKQRKLSDCSNVGTEAMKKLMDEGFSYHEEIEVIITQCEFCYQMLSPRKSFSAKKTFDKILNPDVNIFSLGYNLPYEIGKRIFLYWVITFHQKYFKIVLNEARDIEGISWTSEKIINELKSFFEGRK